MRRVRPAPPRAGVTVTARSAPPGRPDGGTLPRDRVSDCTCSDGHTCPAVDPGIVLWLEEHGGLSPQQVADGLQHDSGLLGLAGTADMREIFARDDPDARLALQVYLHRLAGGIAAMTVGLGGLDTVVFTGGGGERVAAAREGVADRLDHLRVAVDGALNGSAQPDAEIGAAGAAVRTLVVRAREDLQIAAGVERALLRRTHDRAGW